MKRVAIVSLKFNAGHFSHLIANYSLIESIGMKCDLFVNERFNFLDPGLIYNKVNEISFQSYNNYCCAIFWFPSHKNIWEILKFRLFSSAKIVYVFHEPLVSYSEFNKAGFGLLKLSKLFFIDIINRLTVFSSSHVFLPSKKAYNAYRNGYSRLKNMYTLMPLLFDDENILPCSNLENRKYISYIGTIASDHAFQKFVDYLDYAITNNLFKELVFLIATGSVMSNELKNKIEKYQELGKLCIEEGNWLTNDKINSFFMQSVVVWNAYDRSTQSGILAKSFMFGTPVIGNSQSTNEFLIDRQNGIYVEDNSNFLSITDAIKDIIEDFELYSLQSRETFLSKYYYKNYTRDLKKIIYNEKCNS